MRRAPLHPAPGAWPPSAAACPLRLVRTSRRPSPDLLKACARFGIALLHTPRARHPGTPGHRVPSHLLASLRAARLCVICGPSGAGKSTLLHALGSLLRAGRLPVITPRRALDRSRRTVLDLLPGAIHSRLLLLSRSGLSDATLLPRTPAELSEGQRHRFALADAIGRAQRAGAAWLLVDEFASTLDSITARGLCRTIGRWARDPRSGTRIVLATAREELLASLRPDLIIRCTLDRSLHWSLSPAPSHSSKGNPRAHRADNAADLPRASATRCVGPRRAPARRARDVR